MPLLQHERAIPTLRRPGLAPKTGWWRALLVTGLLTGQIACNTLDEEPAGRASGRSSGQNIGRPGEAPDQAGSMVEEDARRMEPVESEPPARRPDPVQRSTRPPVDQPRIR